MDRLVEALRLARQGQTSPLAAQNAVERIAQLCSSDQLDRAPSVASRAGNQHPPAPGYVFAPIMAPSRILVVANIASLPAAVPPARSLSTEYRVEFDAGPGWIIGMRGSVVDQAAVIVRSSIGLRMFLNDGEELVTDGQRAAFVNYDALFSPTATYFPVRRYVRTTDVLYVQFENYSTTTAYTPTLALMFCRDEDMRTAAEMFGQECWSK